MSENSVKLSNYVLDSGSCLLKNDIGESYNNDSLVLKEVLVGFFDGIVKKTIRKGMRILDVGCGTGANTMKFLPLVGDEGFLLGVDISEGMISTARKNDSENVKFCVADVSKLCENEYLRKSELFDIVFSSHCLHWVEDKKSAFSNFHSKLKKGGYFIATFGVVLSEDTPIDELINSGADEILKEETEHIQVWIDQPEVYVDLLENCGFEKIHVSCFTPAVEFIGKDEKEVLDKLTRHYGTFVTIV